MLDAPFTLSVICPVYNARARAPALLAHVSSLLKAVPQAEVIMVDDRSTDGTWDLLMEGHGRASQELAGRWTLMRQALNGGPSLTRNRAMHAAKGTYLCFLDDDDTFELTALQQLVAEMSTRQADVITLNMQVETDSSPLLVRHPAHPSRSGAAYLRHCLEHAGTFIEAVCAFAFHRQFLLDIGWSFRPHVLHEDCLSTPQALLRARTVWHFKPVVYLYRPRPGSIMTSTTNRLRRANDLLTICEVMQAEHGVCDRPTSRALLGRQFHMIAQAWQTAGANLDDAARQRAVAIKRQLLRHQPAWTLLEWMPPALLRKRYLRRVRTCLQLVR